ncbi:transcription elongation factor GreB [Pseudoxanthomonas koreensis]|uniref:transcription elongation factor GreB n=1 Tax=Pseudoxanthomonas koreensis TaxID=266061 RepID=UPI00139087C9|nr:transcription elongation factor GreB [Pseudoxanthomonas koreensis]KAF1695706.1 transcription elongation factor GreB [Pseudoxanthomonas koreensis]
MSRWRPPPEKSTALITRAGHDRLKAELDELWRVKRPEVVKALAAAAAEGDRSENAEYTYRKKQLGEIDRRVRYLGKRVPALKVVEQAPSDPDAVFFGAWVELERVDSGALARYRIVGPDETDAQAGWISIDSPLARALLKKRIDDEVEAQLPGGPARFAIVAVEYPDPS